MGIRTGSGSSKRTARIGRNRAEDVHHFALARLLPRLFVFVLAIAVMLPMPARADIVTLGAPVFDPNGNAIGTVIDIKDDHATIDTGTMKVTLTLLSFAMRSKGLVIAMTRPQLEATAVKVQARGDAEILAMLVTGASVFGPDGQVAALVDMVEGRIVTLRVGPDRVKLEVSAFTRTVRGIEISLSGAALSALVMEQRSAGRQDGGVGR